MEKREFFTTLRPLRTNTTWGAQLFDNFMGTFNVKNFSERPGLQIITQNDPASLFTFFWSKGLSRPPFPRSEPWSLHTNGAITQG